MPPSAIDILNNLCQDCEGAAMVEQPNAADRLFAQRKWDDERELRKRGLDLQELETKAKIEEQRRSRMWNPLVIAVIAAALAATRNAVIAWMNGQSQMTVERTKNDKEFKIEEEKAEAARILEAIRTTPDQAAKNLRLLLDAGLISSRTRHEGIDHYLRTRPGGQGAGTQAEAPPSDQGRCPTISREG